MDKNRLVGAIGFIRAIKPQLNENELNELKKITKIRGLARFADELMKFEDKVLQRVYSELDNEIKTMKEN